MPTKRPISLPANITSSESVISPCAGVPLLPFVGRLAAKVDFFDFRAAHIPTTRIKRLRKTDFT
ncbi:hypothetical protein ACTXT7_010731 [Hymenolepis weldensis]